MWWKMIRVVGLRDCIYNIIEIMVYVYVDEKVSIVREKLMVKKKEGGIDE